MLHARHAFAATVAVAALTVATVPSANPAAPTAGAVRLFSPSSSTVLTVHTAGTDEWVEFDPAIYLKAIGARFEIDVRRTSFYRPLRALVSTGGAQRTIPASMLNGWSGLQSAFVLTWRKADGEQISRSTVSWCPNDGQASPLSPSSAKKTVFTGGCAYNAFTRSQRWGIDEGWARRVLGYGIEPPETASLGDHALLDVSMRKDLAQILQIPESGRTLHLDVTVKHVTDEDPGPGPEPTPPTTTGGTTTPGAITGGASRFRRAAPRTTTTAFPDDALPDLIALPAFGMSTHHDPSADYLDFAATVYNGGHGPLVAEGYRRGSAQVMDAYQRFYRGTQLVGTSRVGTMEYDSRPSHQHWHFEDFATYDLVDRDHHRVRTSGKEAFCLAPTDAIDLLLPGAAVDPGNGDLGTACGDLSSIWVREVLAAGWGDTYTQQRAGQSINITSLPNGTYWLRVTANPADRLHETRTSNNVSLRRVVIGGPAGARRVWVPPVGLVDSEKLYFDQGDPGVG